jgi:hypothetical protein
VYSAVAYPPSDIALTVKMKFGRTFSRSATSGDDIVDLERCRHLHGGFVDLNNFSRVGALPQLEILP